jgi:hypothetical protein
VVVPGGRESAGGVPSVGFSGSERVLGARGRASPSGVGAGRWGEDEPGTWWGNFPRCPVVPRLVPRGRRHSRLRYAVGDSTQLAQWRGQVVQSDSTVCRTVRASPLTSSGAQNPVR